MFFLIQVLLDQLWGLCWCSCKRFLSMGLKGWQLPSLHKGCSYSVFLKFRKWYNTKGNREPFLISFHLQTFLSVSYLLHNSKSKKNIWRALKWNNWKGNLLILEMGAWKTFPPPLLEKGEGGDNRSPPHLRTYQELVFSHIQMQLMSEQFNPDFRKRKQDLLR